MIMNELNLLESFVETNDYDSLKKVLENKNIKEEELNNLFSLACSLRTTSPEIIEILLSDSRINPLKNEQDFVSACMHCSKDVVEELLNDKRIKPEEIRKGEALLGAAMRKDPSVLRYFLENKIINPNLINCQHIEEIIKKNDIELLKIALKDDRLNVNIDSGRLLYSAFQEDDNEIIKLLLSDEKIDPAIGDNIYLIISISNNRVENTRLLFETGKINPKARNNNGFINACFNDNDEIIKLYIKYNIYDFEIDLEKNLMYQSYKYLKEDTIQFLKNSYRENLLEELKKEEFKEKIQNKMNKF